MNKTKIEGGGIFFLWAISLGRVVVPSPQTVMYLTRNYEKKYYKEEPAQSLAADNQTFIDPVTFVQE